MFRKWIKAIIFECLNEVMKDQPLILANRPPTVDDVYEKGTIWQHGKDTFHAKSVNVIWEKHE